MSLIPNPPNPPTTKHDKAPHQCTPPPPPPKVRFERTLIAGNQLIRQLDGWIHRFLPEEHNPLAQTGRAANLALIVAVATGILLLIWYSPSHLSAYSSIQAIEGRTMGGWVRTLHRYSSDLTMLLLLVHAGRMFFQRKFTGARCRAWVTGVILMMLVWFIGWTGYWLVWDQPAQQVAVSSMHFLDAMPIFGEPMSRQFLADRMVPSLLFFVIFFLHMLLPLGIAAGLVMHLSRLNRVRLLPNRWLSLSLITGMAFAAWLIPAPLDAPAEMAVKAEQFTVDAWYLTSLALGLRFQSAGLWIGLGLAAILAAFPWLLSRRTHTTTSPHENKPITPWQTVVHTKRCHACTQCVQDCPFDAVSMIPRDDAKFFATTAWVDPDRCVGCAVCVGSCDSEAMNLTWFDVRTEETRILNALDQHREFYGEAWLALIAGDIDGGPAHFNKQRWQQDLPEYHIEFVPTASWVRPRFIEKALRTGTRGVIIIRDPSTESAARDGNQWILHRLTGERAPAFRPHRAGDNKDNWLVVDFNHGNRNTLRNTASSFRNTPPINNPSPTNRHPFIPAFAGITLGILLIAATVAPSHLKVINPASPQPELIFSFRALGEMQITAELDPDEQAKRPIHMRGRSTEKPRRQPIQVSLTIDGVSQHRSYTAKGIANDGPAIDEWREPLNQGPREITIEINPGPNSETLHWNSTIHAKHRRLHVITYSPNDGFIVE